MISTADEYLSKMAVWDLREDAEVSGDTAPPDAAVYGQIQSYFQNFFLHFEDITRISRQLGIVMQDFLRESAQTEKVAVFLKEGAEKQTFDIERCVKLVEDFTQKINGIYENSRNIISLAHDMLTNNQGVSKSVDQLVANQVRNDEAVEEIFGVIKSLINKTQKIGEITKLINRISSETNLLGLNAKVEAVRAGAAGRGFAIVANEIQRLSSESSAASVDISDTIASVSEEIKLLEKVAHKSKGIFAAQRDSVSDVNDAFEQNSRFIDTYIKEQENFNASIEQIKKDEDTLASAISSIFSSVREVSATAQEISSLTYNQNNAIALLGKLEGDLSTDVGAIKQASDGIKVNRLPVKKRKIAIMFDTKNEFWQPTIRETLKAAEVYNYDVVFYEPASGAERGREMAGYMDEILAQKMDGLVISPVDDEIIYRKLKQLTAANIKIVFINSITEKIDYVSFIQTEGRAAGAAVARAVASAMGGQGEVIVNTWADMQITSIEDRKIGFIEEIRKNTNIIVNEAPVHSKPIGDEKRTFDTILKNYPNARFIFLTNCEWGVAFAKYMKKYRPDIQAITIDFTKDIQQAMRENCIHYAIGQRAYSWGSMALDFIDKSFAGKPVPKYIDTGTYEVNLQNMYIYNSILE